MTDDNQISYPYDEDEERVEREDDPANEVTRDNVLSAINRGIQYEHFNLEEIL
jgi:capsular polysaccharide biosynthesis protein